MVARRDRRGQGCPSERPAQHRRGRDHRVDRHPESEDQPWWLRVLRGGLQAHAGRHLHRRRLHRHRPHAGQSGRQPAGHGYRGPHRGHGRWRHALRTSGRHQRRPAPAGLQRGLHRPEGRQLHRHLLRRQQRQPVRRWRRHTGLQPSAGRPRPDRLRHAGPRPGHRRVHAHAARCPRHAVWRLGSERHLGQGDRRRTRRLRLRRLPEDPGPRHHARVQRRRPVAESVPRAADLPGHPQLGH